MSPKGKTKELPDQVEAHINEMSDLILGKEKEPPTITSPEWNDYVLSHLIDEEWREDKNGKKNPTTDGLTRVAELLFGELNIIGKIVQSPSPENGMIATAECRIERHPHDIGQNFRAVVEMADATPENNATFPYCQYMTAMAGTRAQGRAIRKFLRLRKVVTAEEVGSEVPETEKKVVMTQVNILKNFGEKYNINIWAFVNKQLKEKYPNKVFNYLNEVPYDFMVDTVLDRIQVYQQKDKEGNMMVVPVELQGYDPNFIQERWKT